VALDLPNGNAATRMAERLQGHAGMFKVGSELFTAEGPVPVRYLVTTGQRVFLDLKFHDIPNTVRAAAREAAELGVSMVNVHASGGRKMMEAALEGVRSALHHPVRGSAGIAVGDEARPRVLAVTILTSLASQDLEELGISGTPVEAVLRLARLAQSAGLDGVVASPREISAIRQACGPGFLLSHQGFGLPLPCTIRCGAPPPQTTRLALRPRRAPSQRERIIWLWDDRLPARLIRSLPRMRLLPKWMGR